jgi:uncharacterized repeat protein (TIGR04138 family)
MTFYQAELGAVIERDPRYAYEAYEFLFQALAHTQKLLGREPPEPRTDLEDREAPRQLAGYHVSGPELLRGMRDLAVNEFGLMARVVFKLWGIRATADVGEMVFNLVEANLMSKTDEDRREDFHNIFDLDQALVHDFRFQLDEVREV